MPRRIGYDFDGVITEGFMPTAKDVVITGRPLYQYPLLQNYDIPCPIYCYPADFLPSKNESALWKVEMIKKLGIIKYYEDDEIQFEIIKRHCPNLKLVRVYNV